MLGDWDWDEPRAKNAEATTHASESCYVLDMQLRLVWLSRFASLILSWQK